MVKGTAVRRCSRLRCVTPQVRRPARRIVATVLWSPLPGEPGMEGPRRRLEVQAAMNGEFQTAFRVNLDVSRRHRDRRLKPVLLSESRLLSWN